MSDTGSQPFRLQIVVPCYNEQDVLLESARQFDALLERLIGSAKVSPESSIIFVDDGSRDATWALIEQAARERARVSGLSLSRNRGHQNAVLAGLMTADGDAIVTIDADLQDDINAIEQMVERYLDGYDIVYGVRGDRSTDTLFKRGSATFFYRLLAFFGVELVHNHADFRLMSRCAVEALRDYREVNLYLRGIIPLLGFRTTTVEYARKERFAGESKYPLSKMLKLAMQAITSFSTVPLQMITFIGFLVFVGSMLGSAWVLWGALFTDNAVPGWASTVLPIMMLGGIQILSIGVLGAYLGKIYDEVKSRPRYVIDKITQPRTLLTGRRESDHPDTQAKAGHWP
jgi:glycosyltransferase involved in cell wall biosynthesis